MAESGRKKTKGRQRIEIKKIENEHDRIVTFSKRKSGIYKKICEINSLTGAKVGAVIFSPSGKPYSFGFPSVEAVTNRFLGVTAPADETTPFVEAQRQLRTYELSRQYNEIIPQLDAEKDRGKFLNESAKGKKVQGWWEAPIDDLSLEDVQKMDSAFEDLSKILCSKIHEKTLGAGAGAGAGGASSSSLLPPPLSPHHQSDIQFPANTEEIYPSPRPYGHDGLDEP